MTPAQIRELVNDWCEYAARQGCTGKEFESGVSLIEGDPEYYNREGFPSVLRAVRPEPPRTYDPYAFRVRV